MRLILIGLLWLVAEAVVAARQVDDYRWQDVERIVAIGDVHGDFNAYLSVLQAAGVVDRRGRWSAGETHLVQTGDIPDRGPDTLRIIEHLQKLSRQAERRGGRVHALIGNHEAMNVYGDLRYVSAGEYAAFVDGKSEALRDRYFQLLMAQLESQQPERFAALPEDFRAQWEQQHPLGWVEHRIAWDPRWQGGAELYRWVSQNKIAVQLNDLLFVHGGISHAYCGNSLQSLTEMARVALSSAVGAGETEQVSAKATERGDAQPRPDLLQDELGPLWYRGLAGIEPAAPLQIVEQILQRHAAHHIVIGHSPTGGVIWPRLDARVILIDTGLSAAYGGNLGWLEVRGGELIAGYRDARLPLPQSDTERLDYLQQVVELAPDNVLLARRLTELREGRRQHLLVDPPQPSGEPAAAAQEESAQADQAQVPAESEPSSAPVLSCDTAR